MKLTIAIIFAVSLSLTSVAPANDYGALAAMGYRWVTIHGPYASTTEQDAERLTDHRAGLVGRTKFKIKMTRADDSVPDFT